MLFWRLGLGNMATNTESVGDITEMCEHCGRVTPHDVSLEILTESSKAENAEFSREPYRVTECRVCGATETRRMNNA